MNQDQTPQASFVQKPDTYRFEFTGSGKEYFKIWIVNLLLSILTLGIYSAWAKVRTNRYLYRCVKLDDSGFDYHGSPIAILKGRIITVCLIAALNIAPQVHLALYLVVLVLFLVIMPWLVTRSLAFRMRNSSWRAIRFQFKGRVAEAAKCLYAYGLLSMITLFLAYPVQYREIKKFTFEKTYFGKTGFTFRASIGAVYKVFLLTGLFVLAIGVCYGIGMAGLMSGTDSGKSTEEIYLVIAPLMVILYLALILVVHPFFKTKITNLVWNNVELGEATFESTLTVRKYFKVIAGNLFLTILTLGIYWPWALVKIIRLRVENLSLTARNGLDNFMADSSAEVGAAGEEISSAFDFDISF